MCAEYCLLVAGRSLELLAGVVHRTRAVLLDLDPRDVPGSLRKVAAQTGKRLPPPMARRVIEELDRNEWLRERVTESLGAEAPDDEEGQAASLYLRRPEGWEAALAELGASAAIEAEQHEREEQAQRIAALEAELDATRGRAKRAQREIEMTKAEAEKRVTAARTSAKAGRSHEHQQMEQLRRENLHLHARVADLEDELENTKQRLGQIRAELLKERRVDRPADQPPPPNVWSELDALGAARLLDEVSAALAPAGEFVDVPLPMESPALELPVGVAPDRREAIEWLMTSSVGFVLVVDGYNVTFQVSPDRFSAGEQRQRLNSDLARFRRLAGSRPQVIVVYDSDQTGGITTDSAPGGIEVRFTSAGHSADDEVLMLATQLGGSAVVVSSDRRVREGAERVGALGLWSQALVEWMRG